jgi:hypothetical protein
MPAGSVQGIPNLKNLIGGNNFQNDSMNMSNLNITNECSSLSPKSGGIVGGTLTGPFIPSKLIK